MKVINRLLVIVIAVAIATTSLTSQSTVEGLLRKYNNDENVMAFNLTGDLVKIFDEAVGDQTIDSEIDDLSVLVFSMGDGLTDGDKERVQSLLEGEGFESLINARGEGGMGFIKIYALDSGEHIDKLFAHVAADDKVIYCTLSGKILYEDITKINTDQFTKLSSLIDD